MKLFVPTERTGVNLPVRRFAALEGCVMSKKQIAILAVLFTLVLVILVAFVLIGGRYGGTSAVSLPPTAPSDPTEAYVMMRRCIRDLVGEKMDGFKKDGADLARRDKPDPYLYGAFLKRYFTCPKEDAFSYYWQSIRFDYDATKQIAVTRERGDANAVWREFSKGWEGQ